MQDAKHKQRKQRASACMSHAIVFLNNAHGTSEKILFNPHAWVLRAPFAVDRKRPVWASC